MKHHFKCQTTVCNNCQCSFSAPDAPSDDENSDDGGVEILRCSAMPQAEAEAELDLCRCLAKWSPWEEPTPDIVQAMSTLALSPNTKPAGQRCLLRSQVVEEMVYEEAALASMPDRLQYHGAARYKLYLNAPIRRRSKGAMQDAIESQTLLLNTELDKVLDGPCSRTGLGNALPHLLAKLQPAQ